jgi:hypothetical protein
MKKRNTAILAIIAGVIFFLFQSFFLNRQPAQEVPDEVNQILVSSCYDCHTSAGKNKDAKKVLNFEQWNDYKLTKKISVLNDITEVIGKDKMPPGKYLEFNPEKKLTGEQKELILHWAEEASNALMEGN